MSKRIQEFHLLRHKDIHHKSGEGIVARGVVLPLGDVVLQWITATSSITYFKNLEQCDEIHGHGGLTEIIMGPPPEVLKEEKKLKCKRKKKDD